VVTSIRQVANADEHFIFQGAPPSIPKGLLGSHFSALDSVEPDNSITRSAT
jgi:hypothetical protein